MFANIVVFAPQSIPSRLSMLGWVVDLDLSARLNAKSLGAAFLRHSLSSVLFCLYRAEVEVLEEKRTGWEG